MIEIYWVHPMDMHCEDYSKNHNWHKMIKYEDFEKILKELPEKIANGLLETFDIKEKNNE